MAIDPLYPFVFLGLFSPGPNVILLTASGARFGLRATVPHLLGVAAGVGVTSALTAWGIGALLAAQPGLAAILRVVAAGWILWLAWRLWRSAPAERRDPGARPFTFVQAVLFQWVNPKVWALALTASSAYAAGLSPGGEALRLGTAFTTINLGVCLFWAWAGSLLALLLARPAAWQLFMRTMALALAGFSAMILF